MGPLMILAYVCGMVLYIAFFSGVVYVFVVADPTESPVAGLFRRRLPDVASAWSSCVQSRMDRLSDKIFREANPILKVMTFSLVVGCWVAVFAYAYPEVPNGRVSSFHRPVGFVVFILCMGSWAVACTSEAGTITAGTLQRHDNYPYDNVLYSERICPTVGIRKLARSKYDVASGRHVPRFDHYCPWINNPVGEENYRLFLAFLAVHVGMCWYGSLVTRWILECLAEEEGGEGGSSVALIGLTLSGRHWQLSAVHVIMTGVAIILTIFGSFHMYLVSNNLTTNEYYKWKQLKAWHSKLKKKYEAALREGNAGPRRNVSCFVYDPAKAKTQAEGGASAPAVATNHPDEESARGSQTLGGESPPLSSPSVERLALEASLDGGNVTCAGPGNSEAAASSVKFPVADGAGMVGTLPVGRKGLVSDPGPLPRHKYDIGLLENVREVLFPRSMRPEGPQREWKAKTETASRWRYGSSSGCGKPKAV